MGREATMTIPTGETTAATTPTVPMQVGSVPNPVPTVMDYIHTHGQRCFWDFRDAGWVCARD
jgi:hypothetical protein